MTANDWLVIQRAKSRRDGVRRGAALAALPCVMLGIAIMLAIHLGLSMYSDSLHDEAQRALIVERDTCRADVARYLEIAELEKALVAREVGR